MPGAGCLHDINWKATLLRPITIFAVSNMQVQDGKDNHTKNDSLKTKRAGFEAYPFSSMSGVFNGTKLLLAEPFDEMQTAANQRNRIGKQTFFSRRQTRNLVNIQFLH